MLDTIFAPATGSGVSAVAIVRVSGPAAARIGRDFTRSTLRAREAHFRKIFDPQDDELIDVGLVVFFPGPSSFTGEDCLEFHVHGGRAVVARLIKALGAQDGLRIAEPGEFIKRAFLNGKMPLTSVEGVAELLDAKTDLQRRQALAQADGALASRAAGWRALLIDALALITAELDFADEGDAPSGVACQVREILRLLLADFETALQDARRGEIIRDGFRIVLCGPPNAGKSTLLNALARRDVAIVTEHAGTTRDVLEVELDLGGVRVVLCDTAGIRSTSDAVEAIGIERSRRAMATADLSVILCEASEVRPELFETDSPKLIVATKLDQAAAGPAWCDLAISALSGLGMSELIERLLAASQASVGGEMPLVTNARQFASVDAASRQVAFAMACDADSMELIAEHLRLSCEALEALLGRVAMDDILGAVFSRFCMGK